LEEFTVIWKKNMGLKDDLVRKQLIIYGVYEREKTSGDIWVYFVNDDIPALVLLF
jgi:hypothetical protein